MSGIICQHCMTWELWMSRKLFLSPTMRSQILTFPHLSWWNLATSLFPARPTSTHPQNTPKLHKTSLVRKVLSWTSSKKWNHPPPPPNPPLPPPQPPSLPLLALPRPRRPSRRQAPLLLARLPLLLPARPPLYLTMWVEVLLNRHPAREPSELATFCLPPTAPPPPQNHHRSGDDRLKTARTGCSWHFKFNTVWTDLWWPFWHLRFNTEMPIFRCLPESQVFKKNYLQIFSFQVVFRCFGFFFILFF